MYCCQWEGQEPIGQLYLAQPWSMCSTDQCQEKPFQIFCPSALHSVLPHHAFGLSFCLNHHLFPASSVDHYMAWPAVISAEHEAEGEGMRTKGYPSWDVK